MPFAEENVLDFVKWLEKSYFVERALGRIEKLLAPEFMMVGTGRREVCYDTVSYTHLCRNLRRIGYQKTPSVQNSIRVKGRSMTHTHIVNPNIG